MKKIGLVDLFSGCGGLTDGFKKYKKFKSIAAVEWEKYPCETLKRRLKEKWGYKNADEIDISGFKKILFQMIDEQTQKNFRKLNK